MKKFLAVIISLTVLLLLVSCGQSEGESGSAYTEEPVVNYDTGRSTETEDNEEETEEEDSDTVISAAEPLEIG